VKVPIEDVEEEKNDGEVVVHRQDDDSDASVEEVNSVGASEL